MGFCSNISSVAPEDPNAPDLARSSSKSKKKGFLRKGSGRLEPPAPAIKHPHRFLIGQNRHRNRAMHPDTGTSGLYGRPHRFKPV